MFSSHKTPLRPPLLTIIESPFAASLKRTREQNTAYARECVRHSLQLGEVPFASHLFYPQILNEDDPHERLTGIRLNLAYYNGAQRCAVYADHGISAGMQYAIDHAHRLSIPVVTRWLHPPIENGAQSGPVSKTS